MKTTKAIFGILTNRTSQTVAMTEPVSGRKPVLPLLMRLLGAAALALPVFGAQAAVALTTSHSFTVTDGANPCAALVQGSDGIFYGTTYGGGTVGSGTVFRLTVVPEFQPVGLTNGTLSLTWSTEAGGSAARPHGFEAASSSSPSHADYKQQGGNGLHVGFGWLKVRAV